MGERSADTQSPARSRLLGDLAFGFIEITQDALRRTVIGLALGRECQRACGAHDQAHPEPRLQPRHDPTHRRRREAERPRRRRETAARNDRREDLHVARPIDAVSRHLCAQITDVWPTAYLVRRIGDRHL
jgi:hypothetical protein